MKTIKQTITFKAKPQVLYSAILDPKIHSRFTQAKATGSTKVGRRFTAYDGYISGRNLELVENKKIVQEWTSTDFPKGYKTTVAFEFQPVKGGTKLVFTQTDVPDENYDDIAQGWHDWYWKPLKAMVKNN